MLETKGAREMETSLSLPSFTELIGRLQERDLLIPGPPSEVSRTFLGRIASQQMTPSEIALTWAKARQDVMGRRPSFAKFIMGLHGFDVIKAIIPEKDLAKQTTNHLYSAYKEAANQA